MMDVEFTSFNISVGYIGDVDDNNVRIGTVTGRNCVFRDHVQGFLIDGAEHVHLLSSFDYSNRQSLNGNNTDGTETDTTVVSNDPGHMTYVTDRSGAGPRTVLVIGVTGDDGEGSAVRVRKGDSVVVSDVTLTRYTRGLNVETASQVVLTNVAVKLRPTTQAGVVDNNAKAVELVDCEHVEADNIVIDKRGTNSWGFFAQSSVGGATDNRRGRIRGLTIIDDLSASTGKAQLVLDAQTDWIVERPVFIHEGSVINSRAFVDLNECTRVKVLHPQIRTPDGVADTWFAEMDADCDSCIIEWSARDLDQAPGAKTVTDAGTNNQIWRDGELTIAYTPEVTFATVGDFAPTYAIQQGRAVKRGRYVKVEFNITFSANAYTTASGEFRISLPVASAASGVSSIGGSIVNMNNVDVGASCRSVGLLIPNNAAYAVVRQFNDAAGGSTTTTVGIPASTASVTVAGTAEYRVDA
jgi:hypothetical protein